MMAPDCIWPSRAFIFIEWIVIIQKTEGFHITIPISCFGLKKIWKDLEDLETWGWHFEPLSNSCFLETDRCFPPGSLISYALPTRPTCSPGSGSTTCLAMLLRTSRSSSLSLGHLTWCLIVTWVGLCFPASNYLHCTPPPALPGPECSAQRPDTSLLWQSSGVGRGTIHDHYGAWMHTSRLISSSEVGTLIFLVENLPGPSSSGGRRRLGRVIGFSPCLQAGHQPAFRKDFWFCSYKKRRKEGREKERDHFD